MATLVFSAVGTLLGGPIGGAIGALAGRQVDAMIFAPSARQGPRLNELSLSASSYGLAVPRQHGSVRTGGQVIWATDLVEQSSRQGGGKGRAATVTYSYAASFAVAVSSRPITGIGRIWADGKLLRGAAGDLKVGGTLRVYNGHADQQPDPLMLAAEGGSCPAYRGLAYLVFEDLQLADYGNRIPTLSFEVFADAGPLNLQTILGPVIPDCAATMPLAGLDGLTMESSAGDLLRQLDPLFPLDCDACDTLLTIRPERAKAMPILLPQPAVSLASDDFGQQSGFVRNRSLDGEAPFSVLRHYDPERDYQPGAQRSQILIAKGQSRVLDLPATITATAARSLIESASRRGAWARHKLAWRVNQLDPAVRPGSLVTLPGEPGKWQVKAWEWRSEGIELQLVRVAPDWPSAISMSDPGRVGRDPDIVPGPTSLVAFELPWDGNPATPLPQIFAAAGGDAGWSGASLLVDQGDGTLRPLGSTGRANAILGTCSDALPNASPLLFDRSSFVTIALANPDATLGDATIRQLAQGANRALLGDEIIQFTTARPLGGGRWTLSGLLRGRGGTEHATASHIAGEPLVILTGPLIPLDPALIGPTGATIAAAGLADPAPTFSQIRLAGLGWRPLAPVHGVGTFTTGGALDLHWIRRARGGWGWDDSVDLPVNEQREAYLVEFGTADAPFARWDCAVPRLHIAASEWLTLAAASPGGAFFVRQIGDRAASLPLVIRPV